MKKKTLLICDREKQYSKRFQEVMNELYYDLFETVVFTTEKSLNEYLLTNKADILLTSMKKNPKNMEAIKRIFLLSEIREDKEKENVIYKYSPVSETVRKIVETISLDNEEPEEQNHRPFEIIGVYTPVKRCFQTTFSLCMGQMLAKDKKTLYLNFEGFSGFDYLSQKTIKADIMDALYLAECGNSSFDLRLEAMAERLGELRYISPTKAFTNLSAVTPAQWMKLLDTIIQKTDFEVLIMDLSEQVNGLLDILDRCSQVYTIVDSGRVAEAKIAQYEMLLKEKNYLGILGKTKSIKIPVFKDIPTEFEMLPYSELAVYIKRLLNNEDRAYGNLI